MVAVAREFADIVYDPTAVSPERHSSSTEASSFRTPSGLPAAGGVDGLSRDSRNEKGLYEAGGVDGLSRAPRDVQALREAGGVEGLS